MLVCIANSCRCWVLLSGYGLIRLYVLFLMNKQGSTDKSRDQEDRFLLVVSQVLAIDMDKLVGVVKEYEALYRRCFQLCGPTRHLKQYATLPSTMEKLYSSSDSCCFDPALHFSRRFHQYEILWWPRRLMLCHTDFVYPVLVRMSRHVHAEEWAEHCTLVTHALFCTIPGTCCCLHSIVELDGRRG